MTLRVLITGTSHCAALRSVVAADRHGDSFAWKGLSLRFAAIPNAFVAEMSAQDGILTAASDNARRALRQVNGRDRFSLADIDAVVLCGGLMSSFAVTRLYVEARWYPLPSLVAAGGTPPPDLPLISQAAALAALCGRVEEAVLFPLLRNLTAQGQAVAVLQDPRVSQLAIGTGRKRLGFTRIAKGPDAEALSQLYDQAVVLAYGGLAKVVLQPQATRAGGFFTDASFRRGATRLAATSDKLHAPDDVLHANADYGALVLDDLARALTGGTP